MDNNDSRIKDIIYKRKNGEDLVNDPEAIKSCKNEQNRDVIDNARLGSYDKYGNYVIIPDIKRELISIPKLIYSTNHTATGVVYDLKATIPIFGDVFFKLSIGRDEAVLSLTESVNREAGGYLEVYDEPIDSFALGKDRLPESIIFRTFHITDKPDDFGKKEVYEYNNILTRKVYLNLLSKELRKTSVLDEKQAFDNMVSTLKNGGEYGKRVLAEFVDRLKERPAVFEIANTESYNKAVNEVLLSALDIATTDEDKQNPENKNTYMQVLNARNESIDKDLRIATDRVNEQYVKAVVKKATEEFDGKLEKKEDELDAAEEFYARVSGQKRVQTNRKRNLEKPILKQGKEGKEKQENEKEPKTKEEKVKAILDKKKASAKKTPANKKLKAAKGKSASKKLKAGSKAKGKGGAKKKKAAVKKKGKKVKKAKAPQKAKAKGASFSAKPGGGDKPKKKKKQDNGNVTIKMSLAAAFKQQPKEPTIDNRIFNTTKESANTLRERIETTAPVEGYSLSVNTGMSLGGKTLKMSGEQIPTVLSVKGNSQDNSGQETNIPKFQDENIVPEVALPVSGGPTIQNESVNNPISPVSQIRFTDESIPAIETTPDLNPSQNAPVVGQVDNGPVVTPIDLTK